MKHFSLRASAPVLAGFVLLGGCGLLSSDIFKVTFDLPTQTYSFDTSQWGSLPPSSQGATFPSIACASDAECCTLGAVAGISCSTTPLTCKAGSCEADVPVSQPSRIDLATDVKPSLSQYSSFANVSISKIQYSVSSNTLNVDIPPISIYLAPDGVTDPNNPQAVLFGTVPTIPAGKTPTGDVQLVANGGAVFQMFTGSLSTPFEIIAATTVAVTAGTPIPSGALTVSVTGVISAQP